MVLPELNNIPSVFDYRNGTGLLFAIDSSARPPTRWTISASLTNS